MENTESEIDRAKTIDGEIVAVEENTIVRFPKHRRAKISQQAYLIYLAIPSIFLTVTLLGGLRLGALDNAFIFLKPALVCLVFRCINSCSRFFGRDDLDRRMDR